MKAQAYLGRYAHQPFSETNVLLFSELQAFVEETSEIVRAEQGKKNDHPDADDEDAWL